VTTHQEHKAGFVNILGNPNVGKSTLMNVLVGEHMSIINRKPQTTRHRILGILNTDTYQIVFSDTPGRIHDPKYEMQLAMNRFIRSSYQDADVVLFMTTALEKGDALEAHVEEITKLDVPKYLILNKCDLVDQEQVDALVAHYRSLDKFERIFAISAMHKRGTEDILPAIVEKLPVHPPFYPKDQLTDRPERFFVTEFIRDNILDLFHQEIPYSCEVVVEDFKEGESRDGDITRIRAVVYVNRKSQKSILIGKGGEAIKRLGTRSRKDIESFLQTRVFLDLNIKVRENWRDDEASLKRFGY
jgi:GTP-binding protein Era